ncbi:MAG: hypothetical protein ACOY3Z_07035 [Thermodesulfobacteriota bacterium]
MPDSGAPSSHEKGVSRQLKDQQAACAVCDRLFPMTQLTWEREGHLCPMCLAERQSCGCSD